MKLEFTADAMKDYRYWKTLHPDKAAKIKAILSNVLETPFSGIGKPEPLLYGLKRHWSRRIDKEHRLVYKVEGDIIVVVSCRHHYEK